MIKLHGLEVSGNTYKAQLLMNILNIDYQSIPVDIANRQHKTEYFLALNPRGEFPVLEDGSQFIWDSQAILIYLARQYGGINWYPDNPIDMALITQWLTVANGDIFNSLAKARSMLKFSYPGDLDTYQRNGTSLLKMINHHLKSQQENNCNWIATQYPSLADIACYPYIALCEEGGISLSEYSAIHKWIGHVQNIEGYIKMPGLPFNI